MRDLDFALGHTVTCTSPMRSIALARQRIVVAYTLPRYACIFQGTLPNRVDFAQSQGLVF